MRFRFFVEFGVEKSYLTGVGTVLYADCNSSTCLLYGCRRQCSSEDSRNRRGLKTTSIQFLPFARAHPLLHRLKHAPKRSCRAKAVVTSQRDRHGINRPTKKRPPNSA
ncbi:hypothetical protein LSTR_LSTR000232 [Laodelphax striatellus]|uniref:Uncharacterized protein n=1 Tax=Laodelphax striatellus TaxID=195883 RepID=A0A482X7S8_LAOST|nr:hypothetical protein LSTR_LSTR000232 [Laodelphax striatellus]